MTYLKEKVAGRSMAEAISVICSAVTNAGRWNNFHGCIELSNGQTVSIGGDYMRGPGIRILGGPEPQKAPAEIDAEAYAVALRPLFDDLAAGELVVPRWNAVALEEKPFPAHIWRSSWKLIVDGQNATLRLLDASGLARGEYELLSLKTVSVEPLREAARSQMSAPSALGRVNAKPGRKVIDDAKPLQRLIELLSSGKGLTVHGAVTIMWEAEREKLHLEGASFRAAHERLRGKLKKTHIIIETQEGDLVKPLVPA